MPKTAIDYSRTIIYKIVCDDLNVNNCYIGSTTNFTKRKTQHKKSCNNVNDKDHNIFVYQVIRENGGWDNWSMIEIEKYPCNDKNEALHRERYWIETLKADLNKIRPIRTIEEKFEYYKQYYCKNKEHKQNRQKQRYQEKKSKKHLDLLSNM